MPTTSADSIRQVRDDFDRIASLTSREAEARDRYTDYLLSQLPAPCERALEIGCGFGAFARLVAERAHSVVAVDLSTQMIRGAIARSRNYPNLEFLLGDFLQLDLQPETFDCIITNATLHHLPLDAALSRMKSLLRPNGVLVIHDLLASDGFLDVALDFVRFPISAASRFWRTGRLLERSEVRRAWAEHGRNETYLTLKGVRAMRDEHLPGALLRPHLLWRYTVVWRREN